MESDLEYYVQRLEQEQALTRAAASVEAASVHRALALIYADEVRRLEPAAPHLRLIRPR